MGTESKALKTAILMLVMALAVSLLASCAATESGKKASKDVPKAGEYANKRIAILTGTNFPDIISEEFPNAEQIFFNSISDMVAGLHAGKVDAIAMDEPVARSVMAEQEGVAIADGYLAEFDFAYIFPKTDKGQALCDEISEYMTKIQEDGTMKKLQDKWFDSVSEESMMPFDPKTLPDTKGTIRIATLQYPPFTMQGQEMFYGYDVEILGMFGKENGYRIEFADMNADAIIPAINSVKFDMSASATSITEERKETVLFSVPEYSGGVVLMINDEAVGGGSVLGKIKKSFENTFIRDNRYMLFVRGVGMTIMIVTLSALFGTLLGFLIFMSCRHGNPLANRLAGGFNWLMSGMPMVVLLMILYYIVFANMPVGGAAVAIIGFTMTFGAEVYSMIKTAVNTVDIGQTEAAYALGYSDRRAFFRHILPQAMPNFMPSYRGSLVSLVKATSIVGYVAVQDLTKMGDIVRSKTFEAFFPLIAIAIIYFILGGILVHLVNRLTLSMDPERRNEEDILEGVKVHD